MCKLTFHSRPTCYILMEPVKPKCTSPLIPQHRPYKKMLCFKNYRSKEMVSLSNAYFMIYEN